MFVARARQLAAGPPRCSVIAWGLATILSLASVPSLAEGRLRWSDEFDGNSLNPANWESLLGDGCQFDLCGWGNNELQWYTARPENLFVADGKLHIVAREDYWQGQRYTSARIRTKGRADFLYGRMEARIRLPEGEGIWPAFWLLPSDSPYGGWAASGEIDILEAVDVPWQVHGTLIYGESWPNQVYDGSSYSNGGNFADGFHVYALEWEPDEMRWYVDDVRYHRVTSDEWWSAAAPGNPRAPFDTPFHFLLNVAVGGDWPGSPDSTTQFPQQMVVDYVRVYDRSATGPFHGTPAGIPGRVEAEDFDNGGAGVAYHDSDPDNIGGAYRSEGVDLAGAAHGGYHVGWIAPGEWLEYSVSVAHAGYYDIHAGVAAPSAGGSFTLLLDGTPLGDLLTVPATGGWQNWTTISGGAFLPAGEHRLRFQNGPPATGYNVSYFEFALAADTNADGQVDFGDALPLLFCMTGVDASPANPACAGTALAQGDLDGDGDLDLRDAAFFQLAFHN